MRDGVCAAEQKGARGPCQPWAPGPRAGFPLQDRGGPWGHLHITLASAPDAGAALWPGRGGWQWPRWSLPTPSVPRHRRRVWAPALMSLESAKTLPESRWIPHHDAPGSGPLAAEDTK